MTGPVVMLVTGVSCTGKSTLSRYLTAVGERAISLDANADLCRWVDGHGEPVDRPPQPSLYWLRRHQWCWDADVLDTLIAAERRSRHARVFLCGSAANQYDLLDRFDVAVMLDIPAPVMLSRLTSPGRGNDFGRVGASAQALIERYATDRARMAAAIAYAIDATQPLIVVANTVLGIAAIARQGELTMCQQPSADPGGQA